MIRVLVAEDSPTARALLVAMLSSEPGIQVVGEAADGHQAVEMAERLRPDLVTMDVHMPGMDGLEATKRIMMRAPCPIIIVSSAARQGEVELSLEATRAGALLALPKPSGPSSPAFESDRRQLVSMVRAMSGVKVVRRHGESSRPGSPPATAPQNNRGKSGTVQLVAIAASTGGPAAVRAILSELPRSFPVPMLVVQHIARGFTDGLVHWLDSDTLLKVRIGELGEPALPGNVYLAPDDRHLGCRIGPSGDLRIVLDNAPPVGAFRPSASYLFRSCSEALGNEVLSVILTGMGDDGVAGLRVARSGGGYVIAQDEASSVIYGMPREAQRAGVVDAVLPLESIARRITELVT